MKRPRRVRRQRDDLDALDAPPLGRGERPVERRHHRLLAQTGLPQQQVQAELRAAGCVGRIAVGQDEHAPRADFGRDPSELP